MASCRMGIPRQRREELRRDFGHVFLTALNGIDHLIYFSSESDKNRGGQQRRLTAVFVPMAFFGGSTHGALNSFSRCPWIGNRNRNSRWRNAWILRDRQDSAPAIIKMMAMTQAKTGRLIKKFSARFTLNVRSEKTGL